MKLIIGFSALTAVTLSLVQPGQAASTREVYNIAKSVTVKIDVSQNGAVINQGSGFLVKKQGNIYSLVTNKHVTNCLETGCAYIITAPDGQRYPLTVPAIEVSSELDLAVIKFTSSKNYSIAKLGNSNQMKVGEIVYTAGFPVEAPNFRFGGGEVIANAKRRLTGDSGGYTLIYNAYTNKGMSGSGVFDQQGRVIAIHGHGDRVTVGTMWKDESSRIHQATKNQTNSYNPVGQKMGINRGIPVQWLLNSNKIGANSAPATRIESAQTADEFLILGMDKFIQPDNNKIKTDKQQALAYFSQAIQLQPNYGRAYLMRAIVKVQLGDSAGVREDVMKSYQIDFRDLTPSPYSSKFIPENQLDQWLSNNRNFKLAGKFMMEGSSQMQQISNRSSRQQQNTNNTLLYQEALKNFDQAIQLLPKDSAEFQVNFMISNLYLTRGDLRKNYVGDIAGGITDFKQASKFYPIQEDAYSYYHRGYLKENAQDQAGAIADYRKSAQLAEKEGNKTFLLMANQKLNIAPPQRSKAEEEALAQRNPAYSTRELDAILAKRTRYSIEAQAYIKQAYRLSSSGKDKKLMINYLRKAAELYKKDGNLYKYKQLMEMARKYETENQ
jgi:tetratricopeptide (TPR) repeat protein